MGGQDTLSFCVGATGLPAGTVLAVLRRVAVGELSIPVCGRVLQLAALRTDKAGLSFIIDKFPGFVSPFLSFVPGIGDQRDLAVIQKFLHFPAFG